MDVQKLRDEIPVLANLTYMNTGWSGPPPRRVAQALKDRIDLELEEGPTTAPVQQKGRETQALARQAAARLLNADPEDVMVTRNTTEGLNIVLSGLDWRQGDEIITCNLEHGSVLITSLVTGKRHGVKVRVVDLDPHDSRETILGKFEAAFTPRTRLVFVSHVEYSTGLRLPAAELCQLAHDRGALIMLDGAQTGGHLHLDMTAEGFDFYSIPGQKWVLGYEGVGALYIRPGLIEQVHPAHTGGRAMLPTDEHGDFQPNTGIMEKFLGGSGSVPLQAAFVEAANFIQDIGVEAIEERNLDLADRFKAQLAEISSVNIIAPLSRQESSGLVSFSVAGHSPDAVVASLWNDHRIVVRQVGYPQGVRASLHFFNTEEEVDKLAGAVAELAGLAR
jgi:L-cysteine/cystine lyase